MNGRFPVVTKGLRNRLWAIIIISVSYLVYSSLTGLFNKTYIRQRLEEEFYRSKRYNHPLSLMMIDLDNFKALNDHFGHTVGDHLLRYFSQVIADTIDR